MIQLKLDTQALNNLFPEGTQARMDLQAAVIKNVVDSVIGKRVTEEIENMVIKHVNLMMPANHEIEKIVHKEFADYIQKRYAYSDIFDINSGGIRQIKELITTNVKNSAPTCWIQSSWKQLTPQPETSKRTKKRLLLA